MLVHEPFLERVEGSVLLQPLHRLDFAAVGLHGEDRARLHGAPVQHDGAGAAVGGIAADVSADEPEDLADEVHEQEARLHVGLELLSVDGHLDDHPHPLPPARSSAFRRARAVRIRTRSRLYSTDPRRSAAGSAAAAASSAARVMAVASGRWPASAASAAVALMGTGPTFVSPIPAAWQMPSAR